MASVDWGTVPAWVGLGTVAVGVAAYAKNTWDAWRSRAAQVFVWAAKWDQAHNPPWDQFEVTLVVLNKTAEPIFDVVVEVFSGENKPFNPRERRWLSTVRPERSSNRLDFSGAGTLFPAWQGTPTRVAPYVDLAFTDGRGRRWHRDTHHRLRRKWRG
jgi:hypothetical protein